METHQLTLIAPLGPIEVTDACFSDTNAANPTFTIPSSVTADPGPVPVTIELTVADTGTPALQGHLKQGQQLVNQRQT
jgi:hypothetical protein